MIPEKRYNEILSLLRREGAVRTSDIKDLLGVSFETVRRDVKHLEQRGMLRRSQGGIVPADSAARNGGEYVAFDERMAQNRSEKAKIAQRAADFVSEGQSIALDSGTTAVELTKVLKNRFKALTIVTNSLSIADELRDAAGFTVIITGGVLRGDERALVSDMATRILQDLSIDIFFLTTCGVSVQKGVTYQRVDEVGVQIAMLESSSKTILIADSTKMGVNSLVKMCDLDSISMIVTDDELPPEQLAEFSEHTVVVTTAEGDGIK